MISNPHKGKRKQADEGQDSKPKKIKTEQPKADSNWAKLSKVIAPTKQNKPQHPFKNNKFSNNNNKLLNNNKGNNKLNTPSEKINAGNNEKPSNKPFNKSKVNIFDPKSFNEMSEFYDAVKPTSDDSSITSALALSGCFEPKNKILWVCVVNLYGNICFNAISDLSKVPLMPEQSRKLQYLHTYEGEIPGDIQEIPLTTLGKRVQSVIKNKVVVTKNAGDLIHLLMLEIAPKNKREFTKYPLIQELDYYQMCKQYLNISRYPINATVVDQARLLIQIFTRVKKQWKKYLFERKSAKSEKEGEEGEDEREKEEKKKKKKKVNEGIVADLSVMREMQEEGKREKEGGGEEGEKKKVKGPQPVMKKKSRFISKSDRGSFWKYRPQEDKRFGMDKKNKN